MSNAFRDEDNFVFYEPLNPKVKSSANSAPILDSRSLLGHPDTTDYFADLRAVGAGEIFPPKLGTAWRRSAFDEAFREHIETYFRELQLRAAAQGKRTIIKLENPAVFSLARQIFPHALSIATWRKPEERLRSYWVQVARNRNHYFFGRELAWAFTNPATRGELFRKALLSPFNTQALYNEAFWLVESLCQKQVLLADWVWDSDTGELHQQKREERPQRRLHETLELAQERAKATLKAPSDSEGAGVAPRSFGFATTLKMLRRVGIALVRDLAFSRSLAQR